MLMTEPQYKRAVLRHPPSRFMVEFLEATKSNGSYHHGMHISPIISGDAASISSRGSTVEYDIWRRWEDCLWLQDTLEQEYARAAREKKTRLQQGKGVKAFNGMYKQDMASSWESLPPGPDPNSVAQDIHGYLPRLTKKGTLFRASQATIDMRQKEFRTLVETLFSDDMPALIQEIRATTIVTDFFGLWRRDYDNMDHAPKSLRSSVSSSVFSSYFSESSPSLSGRSKRSNSSSETTTPRSLPNSPAKKPSSKSRATSTERPHSLSNSSYSSDITEVSRYPQSKRSSGTSIVTVSTATQKPRRRPLSATSSDSSSTHSDGSSDAGSTGSTDSVTSIIPAIVEDVPFMFGHNPQLSNDRPNSVLEVLPEERDMLSKSSEHSSPLRRRPRANTIERRAHRSCQVVGLPANKVVAEKPDPSVRESWQTTESMDATANQILDGLELSLPNPIKDNKFRQSMANAVIPRGSTAPYATDRLSSRPRISTPLTLSDFDIYSDCEDDTDSVNPTGNYLESPPRSPDSTRTSFNPPPSPTSTVSTAFTFSTTTSSVAAGSVLIKAAHNSAIILLRVARETAFADVRQRLYSKFVGQEGIPLSQDFAIAFVPSSLLSPSKGRKRPSSAENMELRFISSDLDWEQLITSANGSKLTLRVLDPK
ncbi:hypothetical protein BDZ97DRAFT_1837439 [Flammula alnicola]|nr:hypothetical protein BDZ97DRAFT_1837439 [Flammula alnicola]